MNEKWKDLRIWFCVAMLVIMFMPWVSVQIDTEVGGWYEDSSNTAVSGFQMVLGTYIGALVYLVPLTLVVMELIPTLSWSRKVFYLLGSVLGMVSAGISLLLSKGLYDSSTYMEDASVKLKIVPKSGFWITLALYLAIIVYTLIKDYSLSKEVLQSKGIKATLSDIAGNVTADISDQAAKVQSGEFAESFRNGASANAGGDGAGKGTTPCPNCGAAIPVGKKFCAKCGNKLEITEDAGGTAGLPTARTAAPTKTMTVREYIAKQKNLVCDKCSAKVPAGTKFCPDCGGKIEFLFMPEACDCGAKLVAGKKFCPDCGKPVVGRKLQETCSKCGADLLFGKSFCVECGEKAEA